MIVSSVDRRIGRTNPVPAIGSGRMRILQVSPHYPPAFGFGGVLQVAHGLSRALTAGGHTVRVLTTCLADRYRDLPTGEHLVDGVEVEYFPVPVFRYWGFSPALACRTAVLASGFDLVISHFHYQFSSAIAGLVSRMSSVPYVVFSHGSLRSLAIRARSPMMKRAYLRIVERQNFADALFVAYASSEELAGSLTPGRSIVVPNGVWPGDFEPRPSPSSFRDSCQHLRNKLIYLYLGRLGPGKGLEMLIPAFREVARTVADAHLVIAGPDSGGFEKFIKRLVGEHGLAQRVSFLGLVTGEDKLKVLQDADVFVLPSESEGLSIAMLEAMYLGVPAVISDGCGLAGEIRDRAAGLVVPHDEEELARALVKLADSELRLSLGGSARRLVAGEHTWPAVASRLLHEVNRELSESSGRRRRWATSRD